MEPPRRNVPVDLGAPLVSVAMTTLNAMPLVLEAVHSILAQDLAAFELIVVDDGSTDGTPDALRALGDPRIKVLQIPRCGRIASLNHAFRAARAPFVAIQDADDLSFPMRLRLELQEMQQRPRLAVVGAGIVPQVDVSGNPLDTRTRPVGAQAARRTLGHNMAFFPSSCMYRKSAYEAAGGFDESLACFEDYDMCVRLAADWEVDNLPEALGAKRRHAGQAFDALHFTNHGYRIRSRILLRYFVRVRHNPVVLARAAAYLVMGPRLRLAWLRLTRRDAAEIKLSRTLQD